jgi:hypothetical protein
MNEEYFKEGLDNAAIHAIQEMAELTKSLTKCLRLRERLRRADKDLTDGGLI